MRKKIKKKAIRRVNILPEVNLPLIDSQLLKQIQSIGNVTKEVHNLVKKAFTK